MPFHIDIPPPHVDIPPPHIDIPPPHIDIPAPHVDIPPPHVDIPHVHVDVPHVHVDIPAPHVDIPPLHVDVPAPHVDIPPLHVDVPAPHVDIPPIELPKLRTLSPAQVAAATSVYGSSIDFSTVFLSNKVGLGGRAFTVGIPSLPSVQIMNVGPEPIPNSELIHELAHVWQSQHHPDPTAFMANSVASQALEAAANKAASTTTFNAYGYRRGKPFGEYAAEQIAQQVQRQEAPIVAHVRSIPARSIDPDNIASLLVPRIEDTALPGVHS